MSANGTNFKNYLCAVVTLSTLTFFNFCGSACHSSVHCVHGQHVLAASCVEHFDRVAVAVFGQTVTSTEQHYWTQSARATEDDEKKKQQKPPAVRRSDLNESKLKFCSRCGPSKRRRDRNEKKKTKKKKSNGETTCARKPLFFRILTKLEFVYNNVINVIYICKNEMKTNKSKMICFFRSASSGVVCARVQNTQRQAHDRLLSLFFLFLLFRFLLLEFRRWNPRKTFPTGRFVFFVIFSRIRSTRGHIITFWPHIVAYSRTKSQVTYRRINVEIS